MNWKKRIQQLKKGDKVKVIKHPPCGERDPGCCNRYFPINQYVTIDDISSNGYYTLRTNNGGTCNHFKEEYLELK